MTAIECKARYGAKDIETVFVSGQHASGSADMRVLERFYQPLKNGELTDEGLIAYGMHLVQGDVRFIGPWVQAMYEVVQRNPQILTKVRLRPNLNYEQMLSDSKQTALALRWFMQRVGEDLLINFTLENAGTNVRLLELINKLDHPA